MLILEIGLLPLFLPSPFGGGAGGEGRRIAESGSKKRQFRGHLVVPQPSPRPSLKGEGGRLPTSERLPFLEMLTQARIGAGAPSASTSGRMPMPCPSTIGGR